jgi:chromosome segregation ATPase
VRVQAELDGARSQLAQQQHQLVTAGAQATEAHEHKQRVDDEMARLRSTHDTAAAQLVAVQVRLCRDRFPPTGDLKYRGAEG